MGSCIGIENILFSQRKKLIFNDKMISDKKPIKITPLQQCKRNYPQEVKMSEELYYDELEEQESETQSIKLFEQVKKNDGQIQLEGKSFKQRISKILIEQIRKKKIENLKKMNRFSVIEKKIPRFQFRQESGQQIKRQQIKKNSLVDQKKLSVRLSIQKIEDNNIKTNDPSSLEEQFLIMNKLRQENKTIQNWQKKYLESLGINNELNEIFLQKKLEKKTKESGFDNNSLFSQQLKQISNQPFQYNNFLNNNQIKSQRSEKIGFNLKTQISRTSRNQEFFSTEFDTTNQFDQQKDKIKFFKNGAKKGNILLLQVDQKIDKNPFLTNFKKLNSKNNEQLLNYLFENNIKPTEFLFGNMRETLYGNQQDKQQNMVSQQFIIDYKEKKQKEFKIQKSPEWEKFVQENQNQDSYIKKNQHNLEQSSTNNNQIMSPKSNLNQKLSNSHSLNSYGQQRIRSLY